MNIPPFIVSKYNFWGDNFKSFNQEKSIGKKIINNEDTLEELANYGGVLKAPQLPSSGKQEHLEAIFNQILFE